MEISITDAAAGVGCAALTADAERLASLAQLVAEIEARVGCPVEVLGLLHLDGDGRTVTAPCAHGVTVIGFRVLTRDGESY